MRGIYIHLRFGAYVDALGPDYASEVSYRKAALVPFGTPGSVRADAVHGLRIKPAFAVELKTGAAFVTRGEREAYGQTYRPIHL